MAPTPKISKKSSSKAKTAVKRKATNAKVKVQRSTFAKQAKTLPGDWPVASKPPTISAKESALRPGSLVQQVCNGQDIHINKQALMAPSLDKEKGRYLMILPGNVNFKSCIQQQFKTTTTENATTNPEDPTEAEAMKSTQQDEEDDHDNGDDEEENENEIETEAEAEAEAETDANNDDHNDNTMDTNNIKSESVKSSSMPQFGKVEGLSTSTPKLCISFPQSHQRLVFPGKKVTTSSKYMWLNCSTRKKGSVACKAIFSSAIVFGAPIWETTTNITENNGNNNNNNEEIESTLPVTTPIEDSVEDDVMEEKTWVHYGGSERTVDGVYRGSKKKMTTINESSPLPSHIPIISKQPLLDERGLPMRPVPLGTTTTASNTTTGAAGIAASTVQPIPLTTTATAASAPAKAASPEWSENDNDIDDDDDEEFITSFKPATSSTTHPRSLPRRQASTKKKKYSADLSEDSHVEEESDSDSKDDEKPAAVPSKKKTNALRIASRRASKTTKPVNKETADSDFDEKDNKNSSNDQKPTQVKKTVTSTKISKKTSLDENFDDSSDGTMKVSKTRATRVTRTRGKSNGSVGRNQPAKLEVPSSSEDEAFAMSDDSGPAPPPRSKRRSSSQASRVSLSDNTKEPSYNKETESDDNDDNAALADQNQDNSLSLLPAKPKANVTAKKKQESKASTLAKRDPIELSDDDNDDDDTPLKPKKGINTAGRTARASRRRSSAESRSYKETEVSELDESESKNKGENARSDGATRRNSKPVPLRSRRKTPTKKVTTKSQNVLELLASDSSEKTNTVGTTKRKSTATFVSMESKQQDNADYHSGDENQQDATNIDDNHDSDNAKMQSAAKRPRRSVVQKVGPRRKSTTPKTGSKKEDVVSTLDTPSPSVKSSPFRARRRKSPGSATSSTKKSAAAKRTVFDLSNDEDFKF